MNGFETRRVSFIDHIFVPESKTKQHLANIADKGVRERISPALLPLVPKTQAPVISQDTDCVSDSFIVPWGPDS